MKLKTITMAMESQKIFSHDNFVHSEMYYTPKFKKYFLFKTFLLYCFPLAFIPLISSSTTRHPAPHNNHTLFHVHEPFFLLVWSLQHLTPLSTSRAVNLLSESLYFACDFSLFIRFPHISEIIWYSSFSDWLISLSIMSFRSTHTVTKEKNFFIFNGHGIPLCKCPIVVLSTHLLMGTWTASISWQL